MVENTHSPENPTARHKPNVFVPRVTTFLSIKQKGTQRRKCAHPRTDSAFPSVRLQNVRSTPLAPPPPSPPRPHAPLHYDLCRLYVFLNTGMTCWSFAWTKLRKGSTSTSPAPTGILLSTIRCVSFCGFVVVVVVVLTLNSQYQVRGHRTGSSHSGAEEHPTEKNTSKPKVAHACIRSIRCVLTTRMLFTHVRAFLLPRVQITGGEKNAHQKGGDAEKPKTYHTRMRRQNERVFPRCWCKGVTRSQKIPLPPPPQSKKC